MVGETAIRELRGEFPNQIIKASAGTGKTFALSNRYLKLLASGAECQTILATTFTKKGAGEILDRIIERLSDAALCEDKAAELSKNLEFKLTRERAAKILFDLLGNLHRLEISTLDSFFNRVAKVFSLELRLPPNWEIVDEQKINRMHDEAIQSVLRDESVLSLLHMLSKGEANRRVASMVRETVDSIYSTYREAGPEPWDQLPLVGEFLPSEQLEMILTRIEELEPDKKSLKKHWQVVKAAAMAGDWAVIAETTSFKNFLDGKNKYGNTNLTADILEIYSALKPHCARYVSHKLISQNHSTRDLLKSFGELLEIAKDETGSLRFDDVTERLMEFVSMWDTERFSFRLDHQIQHLLLDEFQDTSLAQWKVIRPFAKAVTENAETLRSFFCVGDMKQAIFGWRGGVAEIFDLVDSELSNLEQTTKLTASYRSSQPVIDMVNDVFMNVDKYSCDKDLYNEAIHEWGKTWFEEHSTNRAELPGYVTIEMASECSPSQKFFEETKDRARNQKVIQKTVDRVRELLRTIPSHQEIGVIVRTNQEVSELIGRLQAGGVVASEEGGSLLTDSAAVELVLSAVTLADHPGDRVARFHLSHSPLASRFGLEPELKSNQKENAEVARVAAADLRAQLMTQGYGPTIESLASLLIDHCTERELFRLQHLVRVAYQKNSEDDQWELRPGRFAQYIREELKVSDESSARVRVMTIHKCKGLEFDVVVLPIKLSSKGWGGMTPTVVVGRESATAPIEIATRYANESVRKLLPNSFQRLFEQDRQRNARESMCVLYVALTRSVHATHVIVSHGAKPEHKSASGILLATLCPDSERAEGVLYEHGDDRWYEKSTSPQVSDSFGLDEFYLPETVSLKPGSVSKQIRSGRGVPRTSPAQLEGGNELRLGDIFDSHDNYQAVTRGAMIHGCFELVKWMDESMPSREQLRTHLKSIDATVEDYESFIDEFHLMTKQGNICELLSRGTYQEAYLLEFAKPDEIILEANRLEVKNERAFAVQTKSGLLQGVIDRLVLVHQAGKIVAADIIDFKTDAVDEANLQSLIEFYSPQLNGYRDAVSKFARIPMEKISTRLVFLNTGQVVNLELMDHSVEKVSAAQQEASPIVHNSKQNSPLTPEIQRPKTEPVKKGSDAGDSPKVGSPTLESDKKTAGAKQQRKLWE